MNWAAFYVDGQVVSFVSLLIMNVFIVLNLRQRKQGGYLVPVWVPWIFVFLGLDAGISIFLAGFQLEDTIYFYSVRRIFSLLSLLFILLTILDFPRPEPSSLYRWEKRAAVVFVLFQELLNGTLLVLQVQNLPQFSPPAWLEVLRNGLVPATFLLITLLAIRHAQELKHSGDHESANVLSRFSWFFLLGVLLSILVFVRPWLPFAAQFHSTASSYGWMILCAGTAMIFMGYKREEGLLPSHILLLVLLVLLLVLGGVAEIFSASLDGLTDMAQIDRVLRVFIFAQVGILLAILLFLPRWLQNLWGSAKKAESSQLSLTARQRDVMLLLASNKSNQQIALDLHITLATAKHHVAVLMKKYGMENRYQLAKFAREMIERNKI